MPNDYFRFKQFLIKQDKCAMKVGTDGVLLGAWTNCNNATRILDIGTGTGLIALMLAQRSNVEIDAVEIDELAYKQASENINNSRWKYKITVYNSSFEDYLKTCRKKYSLIVSNPPYFSNSIKAKNIARTMARHNDSLPISQLISGSKKLLTTNGVMAIIIPAAQFSIVKNQANSHGLFIKSIMNIYPKPAKKIKRIMVEFSKQKRKPTEKNLIIEKEKRHEYSEEYKELTKEYYLAF
ncbi:MAG: methyltransferase [Chlorobi bacterium]|nr:methyltransferase [Chlorobiota bacterium]